MKSIKYKAEYQTPETTVPDFIDVRALNINTGFTKAAKLATAKLPKGWEVISLTFWQVND